uniref:CCD97-like C-terminal domain-containing protein n=1 Tax=Mycena chlorophos TaxID=658473 RepID=A0ABQ0LD63_MYCCL|nr:predicted protein [Mycena chlorophos]
MSAATIKKYLALDEDSSPDPEREPIEFLRQYITSGLPRSLLAYFSATTTPKQRSVLPVIRNRRLKYTSTRPPELEFAEASTTWPLLYDGQQQGRRGQREGEDEKSWAQTGFLEGSTKHVGNLGKLLGEYEEEREAERIRDLRRQKAEEFVPEEESDSEDEDDEMEDVQDTQPVDENDAKATFERVIRERFIYGLLDGIDYDKADWNEEFDDDMDRDAEDRWFEDDE